jgi:sulfonate transport system substrate-binding protein
MKHLLSTVYAASLILTVFLTVGCGKKSQEAASGVPGAEKSNFTVHIGHQRGDALNLLKVRGDLDKRLEAQGIKVEWINFPAGPQLLEALGVGSLDFGSTGESPAIFAQAAGTPIVYVANIPVYNANGDGQAILVPKDSPIHTLADLKGKKIAFQKASGAHNMVVQLVERGGLSYKDIQPVYLPPPDARVAFESGSIDAWGVWDPYLAVAQQKTQARILANMKGVQTAGSFYLSSRKFASSHPEIIKIVLEEIEKSSRWSVTNPKEAAELLAKNTGIEQATLELLISRRPKEGPHIGVHPIDESVIAAQQTVADNFFRIGLLPKKVNVREAMLTQQEYARLYASEEKTAP